MFQECLRIREAMLGKYHVQTSRTYYSMGCSLHQEGNYTDALLALRRTMRISTYLKDHARQKAVREYIQWVLQKQSDSMTNDQYVKDYQEQLEDSIQWEQTGDAAAAAAAASADSADSDTAASVAVAAYEQSLAIELVAVAESSSLHLDVADLYIKLALLRSRTNDDGGDKSIRGEQWEKARDIYERVWGANHPCTVYAANKRNPTEAIAMASRDDNAGGHGRGSGRSSTVEHGSEAMDSDDEEDMSGATDASPPVVGGALWGNGTTPTGSSTARTAATGPTTKTATHYIRSMSESSMTSATSHSDEDDDNDDDGREDHEKLEDHDDDEWSTGSHHSSNSSGSSGEDPLASAVEGASRPKKSTKKKKKKESKPKKTSETTGKDDKGGGINKKNKGDLKSATKKTKKHGEGVEDFPNSSSGKKKDKTKTTKKSKLKEEDDEAEERKSTSKKTIAKRDDPNSSKDGCSGDVGVGKKSKSGTSGKKKKKKKASNDDNGDAEEDEPAAEEWYSL